VGDKVTANCQSGPTLSDAKGAKRIRKLEDSRLNLQMQVLEKLDCIAVMESEIKVMRESGNQVVTYL
jgi:hypothetical protein